MNWERRREEPSSFLLWPQLAPHFFLTLSFFLSFSFAVVDGMRHERRYIAIGKKERRSPIAIRVYGDGMYVSTCAFHFSILYAATAVDLEEEEFFPGSLSSLSTHCKTKRQKKKENKRHVRWPWLISCSCCCNCFSCFVLQITRTYVDQWQNAKLLTEEKENETSHVLFCDYCASLGALLCKGTFLNQLRKVSISLWLSFGSSIRFQRISKENINSNDWNKDRRKGDRRRDGTGRDGTGRERQFLIEIRKGNAVESFVVFISIWYTSTGITVETGIKIKTAAQLGKRKKTEKKLNDWQVDPPHSAVLGAIVYSFSLG